MRCIAFVTSLLVVHAASNACGPFFPNQVLVNGDASILRMPYGNFAEELVALTPHGEPPFKAYVTRQGDYDSEFVISGKVDQAELVTALAEAKTPADPAMLEQYKAVRTAIAAHALALYQSDKKRPPIMPSIALPKGLSAEFELYLRGLIAFHQYNIPDAQKAWTDLLALPADQRKHRSTWAAFMLGKSYLDVNPAKAIEYFTLTRKLANDGFTDTLRLASSSLGWHAKVELNSGNFHQAIALYIQQHWTGDHTAADSLRLCAQQIFARGPSALTDAAKNPDDRWVVTAYVIGHGGRFHEITPAAKQLIPAWLAAVESSGVKDLSGADRLAWMAYSSGDFTAASRWISRSPADAPIAQWVQAKLLLRDGKIDQAAAVLGKVVHSFPANDPDKEMVETESNQTIPQAVTSDLAILQLNRGQYSDSMQLLMQADHWMDAAYIAERVLSIDELIAAVDKHYPEKRNDPANDNVRVWHATSADLRWLLARRLTRAGKWSDARPYYPAKLRPILDDYITGIREGHDRNKSAADRAAAFFLAAKTLHQSGMELLGTELSPDYSCYGGHFTDNNNQGRAQLAGAQLTGPGEAELARYQATAPDDPRRFHYRYIALAHAWSAAELMPDNTDDTAKVLYEAGCWMKDRDPKSADKFYKALVHRCPDTDLGKAAAAAHWFPVQK